MIFEIDATINLDDDTEHNETIAANSLDVAYAEIDRMYPTHTSVVLVFCKPKSE